MSRRRGRARYGNVKKDSQGRNATEAQYGDTVLELRKRSVDIIEYKFEPITLRLTYKTQTSYKPDYVVQEADGYLDIHEIKGSKHIEEDAWLKLKWAAEEYPWFRFFLVYPLSRKRGLVQEWHIEQVGGDE